MRQNYFKGYSKPYEVRLQSLNGLIKFFEENEVSSWPGCIQEMYCTTAFHRVLLLKHCAKIWDVPTLKQFYMMFSSRWQISRYAWPLYFLHAHDKGISTSQRLRDNLKELMTPKQQPQDLLSFPATSKLCPEPLGVALVIDTWNYPIMLGVLPLAGALAAGNTAILKPSVVSRHTAELLGTVLPKYLDSRLARVVGHTAERDRHMLSALLECKTDKIFFTGSPKVGRIVYKAAASHLTPVTLELGGKNPVLVHHSADIDLAAKRTIWGRMMNGGQQCIAPDYVLIDKRVAKQFYTSCSKWIGVFYEGKPEEPGRVGRIVDSARMAAQVDILSSHQGEVLCGGTFDEPSRYVSPTVLRLQGGDPVLSGETFGPILMCVEVDDMTEACKYVCAKEKPLSMYVFSRDSAVTDFVLQNTSAGGVTVNGTLMHVSHPNLPFGGVGASGKCINHCCLFRSN